MPSVEEIRRVMPGYYVALQGDVITLGLAHNDRYVDMRFNENDMAIEEYKERCLNPAIAALDRD